MTLFGVQSTNFVSELSRWANNVFMDALYSFDAPAPDSRVMNFPRRGYSKKIFLRNAKVLINYLFLQNINENVKTILQNVDFLNYFFIQYIQYFQDDTHL